MGKKYIVEIGRLERLYKAYTNGNGKPNLTWLSPEVDLTPYTEPDLEQARKEAYEEGYKKCLSLNNFGHLCVSCDKYEQGLADAWDAARKIGSNSMCSLEEMGFDFSQCAVTDYNPSWFVVKNYSASECIEKIGQYEQEKAEKIQVGDEVNAPFGKAIVVNINSVAEKIWLVYADGHGGFEYFKDAPTKTGRHFPEIATVLEKMRGEKDG